MKMLFNLFLFGIIALTFTNCNFCKKTFVNTCESYINADLKNDVKEEFNVFITRFHSDSIFQRSRIADTVNGFNSNVYNPLNDTDEQYIWNYDDIIVELGLIDIDYYNDDYQKLYEFPSNSVVLEIIQIDASSCRYICKYELYNNVWMLTSLDVSFM